MLQIQVAATPKSNGALQPAGENAADWSRSVTGHRAGERKIGIVDPALGMTLRAGMYLIPPDKNGSDYKRFRDWLDHAEGGTGYSVDSSNEKKKLAPRFVSLSAQIRPP